MDCKIILFLSISQDGSKLLVTSVQKNFADSDTLLWISDTLPRASLVPNNKC